MTKPRKEKKNTTPKKGTNKFRPLKGDYGLDVFKAIHESLIRAAKCYSGYDKLAGALETTVNELEGNPTRKPKGMPLLGFPVSGLASGEVKHVEFDFLRDPPDERKAIIELLMRSLYRQMYYYISQANELWITLVGTVEQAGDKDLLRWANVDELNNEDEEDDGNPVSRITKTLDEMTAKMGLMNPQSETDEEEEEEEEEELDEDDD